jgi:catalase (peroxidase I)
MTKSMLRRLQRIETCRFRSPRVAAILKCIYVFPDDQVLTCSVEGRWEDIPALFDVRTLNDDELEALIGGSLYYMAPERRNDA